MLAQVTNEVVGLIPDVARVIHDVFPKVTLEQCGVAALVISKLAQIAYKHWTVEGTKMDSLMKTIGVVQEPTTTVVTTAPTKTGNGNG